MNTQLFQVFMDPISNSLQSSNNIWRGEVIDCDLVGSPFLLLINLFVPFVLFVWSVISFSVNVWDWGGSLKILEQGVLLLNLFDQTIKDSIQTAWRIAVKILQFIKFFVKLIHSLVQEVDSLRVNQTDLCNEIVYLVFNHLNLHCCLQIHCFGDILVCVFHYRRFWAVTTINIEVHHFLV